MSVNGRYIRCRIVEGDNSLSTTCVFPPASGSVDKLTVSSPTKPPVVVDRDQVVKP